jgi:hypothetical protein
LLKAHRAAVFVWVGLMGATLASWWLGIDEGGAVGDGASVATLAVIVVAFVKIRFIGSYFMELRHAPLWLRVVLDAYVVVVCSTLAVIYLVTT